MGKEKEVGSISLIYIFEWVGFQLLNWMYCLGFYFRSLILPSQKINQYCSPGKKFCRKFTWDGNISKIANTALFINIKGRMKLLYYCEILLRNMRIRHSRTDSCLNKQKCQLNAKFSFLLFQWNAIWRKYHLNEWDPCKEKMLYF